MAGSQKPNKRSIICTIRSADIARQIKSLQPHVINLSDASIDEPTDELEVAIEMSEIGVGPRHIIFYNGCLVEDHHLGSPHDNACSRGLYRTDNKN